MQAFPSRRTCQDPGTKTIQPGSIPLQFIAFLLLFSLFSLAAYTVHAQEKPSGSSNAADGLMQDSKELGVSGQDLDELIAVLENEQKRTEFLDKLQTLQAVLDKQKTGEQDITPAKGLFRRIGSWFAAKYALALEMLKSPEGFKILLTRSVLSIVLLTLILWGLRLLHRKVYVRRKMHFLLKYLIDTALATVALSVVLLFWGVNLFGRIGVSVWKQLSISALTIGAIIFAAIIAWRIINTYLTKQADHLSGDEDLARRANTLFPLLRRILRVVVIVVTILIILPELGVNITPLLAGAGIVGIAIGFGAQTLVKDFINGFFILAENAINVGDWVALGGHDGQVEGLSVRNIRLRDIYGNVYTIPWSSVETVKNQTREFGYAVVEPGVAYREDINEVIEVIKQVAAEMQQDPNINQDILSDLQVLGLIEWGDSAIIVRARFKTTPFKRWFLEREFRKRLKIRFDELGIEIPFPHSTVYFGQDKKGEAPPARINLTKEVAPEE
ncbi:MAG: mechanosensitive ion channel domain-containing protein [Thermodesulfobacteriota bacterium]